MADALTSTGAVIMVSPASFLLLRLLGKPEATARPQMEKGEGRDLRLKLGLSAGHWNPEGLARREEDTPEIPWGTKVGGRKALLTLHHFLPPQGRPACLLAGFKGLRKV